MNAEYENTIVSLCFIGLLILACYAIRILLAKLSKTEDLLRKSVERNRATETALKDILSAFEDGPTISPHNASKKILSLALARTVVRQQERADHEQN